MIVGLAQHALVYDRAAVMPYETLDGEQMDVSRGDDDRLTSDVGGYALVARRADSWEAIVEVLMASDAEHPDLFHQMMGGCRALSNSGREVDGLDDLLHEGDQVTFDLAVDREQRREKQGYVTPAQARAFLQMSREPRLGSDAMPPANLLSRAYFRTINETTTADAHGASTTSGASGLLAVGSEAQPAPLSAQDDSAEAVAAIFEIFLDAGSLAQPPRSLLSGLEARAPRLGHIRARLEFALDQDHVAFSARNEELAYLANTLIAGCSTQAQPFTAQKASDAAVAICNLGLENWPPHLLPANANGISAG